MALWKKSVGVPPPPPPPLISFFGTCATFDASDFQGVNFSPPTSKKLPTPLDYVIENSFKIIVIVSSASVNDAHFLTQLQMVVEHMNEVQLEKVVIVFREDIPNNQLPYLVRLFLSKNKPYFRWTDDEYRQRLFWKKLVKVLRANKKMSGLLPI